MMPATTKTQMTIRLPETAAATLRSAACAARLPIAVLARDLLVESLNTRKLPPPAPPNPDALAPETRVLLVALISIANSLRLLQKHALTAGSNLIEIVPILETMSSQVLWIGLEIKSGTAVPLNSKDIFRSAEHVSTIVNNMNDDRSSFPPHLFDPLTVLRTALDLACPRKRLRQH